LKDLKVKLSFKTWKLEIPSFMEIAGKYLHCQKGIKVISFVKSYQSGELENILIRRNCLNS
jgi:hypothetical protein